MTIQMVRAVLTLSGTWKHYALIDAPRTVCGAKVSTPANPGQANCHRCMRWANQRRILVQDPAWFRTSPPWSRNIERLSVSERLQNLSGVGDDNGDQRGSAVRDLQDVEREIADYCVRNRTAPTPAQIIAWEAAWAAYETADAAMVQEYQ